jgi:hypothetical protein
MLQDFLTYLFYPHPTGTSYGNPKVLAVLIFCALLIILAGVLSVWRNKLKEHRLRKITGSWPSAAFWFGLTGLLLVVARAEEIQFLAMRFLWVVWVLLAIFIVWIQARSYKNRYYEILPSHTPNDPRSKYLPGKKHR